MRKSQNVLFGNREPRIVRIVVAMMDRWNGLRRDGVYHIHDDLWPFGNGWLVVKKSFGQMQNNKRRDDNDVVCNA